jgi:biopolymer transport protein ExbD
VPDPNRFFDVWIIETNAAYRNVPYTVVTDWVQQGRLLSEDKVRPAGAKEWSRVADLAAISAYVPQREPHRAEDTAEAMEPVQVEVAWKKRAEDEDDDVDMIPLIDVSLVLLVFFIMTTAGFAGAVSFIKTPPAEHRLLAIDKNMIWVGIDRGPNGQLVYSLGQGERQETMKEFRDKRQLLQEMDDMLRGHRGVDARIKADLHLPYEIVRDLHDDLEQFKGDKRLKSILAEVSEKK